MQNLAFFAGGINNRVIVQMRNVSNVVDIFNATSGTWSTAVLSASRFGVAATSLHDAGLAFFAGGGTDVPSASGDFSSDVVDIYNASSGTWSTAVLSRARYYLAATSLQNLAFFAGGYASA